MSQGILNNIKGFSYEHYVKSELIKANPDEQVWLWSECPIDHLIKNKVFKTYNDHRLYRLKNKNKEINENNENKKTNPLKDIGIDIVKFINDEFTMVQCKNYTNTIKIDDLAGFYYMTHKCPKLLFQLIYTSKLSKIIMLGNDDDDDNKVIYTKMIFPHDPIEYTLANIPEKKHFVTNYFNQCIEENVEPITTLEIVKPLPKKRGNVKIKIVEDNVENILENRQYQIDAIKAVYDSLVKNSRTILSLPCGLGKTYIAYNVSMNYDVVILFSPLMQHAKQNLDRFVQYNPDIERQLVDSDNGGTRDFDTLIKFINSEGKKFLFSTYKSADVILKLCEYFVSDNFLIIIDEFHNLSVKNISDEEDPMYQLLKRDLKVMSMSATPRIYELENEEIDVADLLGEISYNMSFSDAIKNKLVCDYKIYLPLIVENVKENHTMIQKEVDITNVNLSVLDKCSFMCCSIVDLGFRHMICYFQEHANIDEFIKVFKIANEFYALDNAIIDKITCETKQEDRDRIINEFRSHDGVSILCSVRILDECIDIKECDSIFVTYPCKNKIKMVQRLNRCTRTDKLKPKKNCGMLLWANETDDIACTIGSLKEYDPDLVTKVGVRNKDSNVVRANNKVVVDEQIKQTSKFIVGIKVYNEMKWEEWRQLLFTCVNKTETILKRYDKFQNRNLGRWLDINKCKINNKSSDIYIKLSENLIVKKFLDDYLLKREQCKDNIKLTWNQYKNLLYDFVKIYDKTPSVSDEINNTKIGVWYKTNKRNIVNKSDDIYIKLCENSIVKKSLDDFLIKREQNKDGVKLTWEQNKSLLYNFVEINDRIPSSSEEYKNVKIGSWLYMQKNKLTNDDDDIYKKLSGNIHVKKALDEHLQKKNNEIEELDKKKNNNWFDSKKLLFEYCLLNKKIPVTNEFYKNIDLNKWFNWQKRKIKNKIDNMYIKLSENIYVKKALDDYLEKKENNKDKIKIDWDQAKNLLISYCEQYNEAPSKSVKFHGVSIGRWLHTNKQKVDSDTHKIYIKLSENVHVKRAMDKYLKNKDKNKGKVKLTFEQNKELLFEYCTKFKKCPKNNVNYKNVNIGLFLQNKKANMEDWFDESYIELSENDYVKKELDRYLDKKN